MPEGVEGPDRTPTNEPRLPDDVVEEYMNTAFSTLYNSSETQEDDESIGVYEP